MLMAHYVWMLAPLLLRMQAIVLLETVLLANQALMWTIQRCLRISLKQLISSLMTTLSLLPNRTNYLLWALLSFWCNRETYQMRSLVLMSSHSLGSSQSRFIPSASKLPHILIFRDGSLLKPDYYLRNQNNYSLDRKVDASNISPCKPVTHN